MEKRLSIVLALVLVAYGLLAQIDEIRVSVYQNGVAVDVPETFSITPATSIAETVSLNTTGLTPGIYTYTVEVHDVSGPWSIASQGTFLQEKLETTGLLITEIEYFFDSDPGIGSGTSVAFTQSGEVQFTEIINTSSLTTGFHTLFFRAKNQNGQWGSYQSHTFHIQPSIGFDDIVEISAVEYFIDTDPGPGNGIALTLTSGLEVSINEAITTAGLDRGFHNIYIRGKLVNGGWGPYASQIIYVDPSIHQGAPVEIEKVEYFIDEDPGQGSGIALTDPTISSEVILAEVIGTQSLTKGFHTINIRGKSTDGFWGAYESRLVYVDPSTPDNQQLVAVEYFFDTDPGVGAGINLNVSATNLYDTLMPIETSPLGLGTHTVGMRAKNLSGAWSPYEIREVTIDFNPTAGQITITSPSDGQTFELGSSIPVTFSALNLDDTIDVNLEVSLDGTNYTVVNTGTLASLNGEIIWKTDTTDALGDYSIRVATIEGTYVQGIMTGTISLVLPPAPLSPLDLSIISKTQSEALIAWLDNDTIETGFLIESSIDLITWTEKVLLPPDSTSYNLTGLSADSTYFYRVSAEGIGGTSLPSSPLVISTFTPPGNAISLDATDYISTGISPVTGTLPFSVSLWFKTVNAGGQVLVTTRYSGGFSGVYYLGVTNGQLQFATGTAETANSLFSTKTGLNDGIWHHIVGVRESSGVLNLYIDGQLDATKVNSNFSISGFPVTLGRNIRDNGAQFIGQIDEFAIWNQALTAEEISTNWLLPADQHSTQSGLARYLDFDQFSGTTLLDQVEPAFSTSLVGSFESVVSGALQEFIDEIPPTITVDVQTHIGNLPLLTGGINDSTATMTVTVNGETYADVTIAGLQWAVQTTVPLPAGVYDVLATATDSLGNSASDTTINELTILSQDPKRQLDSAALVVIYDTLQGKNWIKRDNWLKGSINTWHGVTVVADRVIQLNLPSNYLKGNFPTFSEGLDALDSIDLSNNELISVRTGSLTGLRHLDVSSNRLVFSELDSLTGKDFTVNYTNQKTVLERERVLLQLDETYLVDRAVPSGQGYSWFKNGAPLDQTGESFEITITSFEDEAVYHAEVTNENYPGLILTTQPVDVRVSSLRRDEESLRAVLDALVTDPLQISVDWNSVPVEQWEEVTLTESNDRVIGIDFSNKKLSGALPEDILDVAGLTSIILSNNTITQIPIMSSLSELLTMDVSGNKLDFGSIEPNYSNAAISFGSQQQIGEALTDTIPKGSDYFVELVTAGSALKYQWAFKGTDIAGATQPFYKISQIDFESMGAYSVKVTSTKASGITLVSQPQNILAYGNIAFYPSFRYADGEQDFVESGSSVLLKIKPSGPYDTIKDVAIENKRVFFEKVVLGDYLLSMRASDGYQKIKEIQVNDEIISDTVTFIPTYYRNVIEWDNADTLRLREFIEDTVQLVRRPAPLLPDPANTGTIGMTVESDFDEGDNEGRLEARRRVQKAGCSLRKRTVSGGGKEEEEEVWELIAYAETNAEGEVNFGFLPSGRYRINIQYPGIPMDPNSFIEFEIDNDSEEGDGYELAATVFEDGITVEVVEELGTLINYFKELNVYPNPADEQLTISYQKLNSKAVRYQLVNMQGQVVDEGHLEKGYRQSYEIDTRNRNEGLYLLRFFDKEKSDEQLITYKLYIRH